MIKYECEECGSVVVTEEAIGQDVYTNDVRGKAFQWQGPDGEILTITYEQSWEGREERPQQFCYGCMFRSIRALLSERFPTRILQIEPDTEEDFDVPTDTSGESEDQVLSQLYVTGQLPDPGAGSTPSGAWRFCACPRSESGWRIGAHPSCPVHSSG